MIPIAKPSLGEEEALAAREVILSGWVTQGPRVKAFEGAFAKRVGSRFACAVSNCTTALHLALLGVGVKPGDVVLTVSHSFIATANAIRCCGAEPVFTDIDPDSYNIDPEALVSTILNDCIQKKGKLYYRHIDRIAVGESPIKKYSGKNPGRVAAVLPVHQMGIPCDIGKIMEIADRFDLPVVEDAACAIGSRISFDNGGSWDEIGKSHGKAACFSFHPRKVLTTGDGGMITTNDPGLDAGFRLLRQHGMGVPDTVRHGANRIIFEDYLTTGFNYRMTDLQAAMGIEQLKRLDSIIDERRCLAACYQELLKDIPGVKPVQEKIGIRSNWQSFPVRIENLGVRGQKAVMQELLDKGISTRRGIMNAHQEPPYDNAGWSLPESEAGRDLTILLPLFSGMTVREAEYIVEKLNTAVRM